MLAKSVIGETGLIQVEELVETIGDTHTVKGEKMEHVEDKAVAEKPSDEDMLKQYEECKMNYLAAQKALDECKSMCKEAGLEIEDEEKEEDLKPVGESAEEETEEGSSPEAAQEEVEEAEGKKPIPNKSATKCLECGCNEVGNAHGRTDVSTAVMVSPTETPKSTIIPEPSLDRLPTLTDDDVYESEDDSDKSAMSDDTISAIIEKAVKSATETVRNEITLLKSASEAAKEEVNKLQTELATANLKAVSGGPKRSAMKVDKSADEFALMAIQYRAKAAATSDSLLARGYKDLAKEFDAKAVTPTNN